MKVYYQTIYFQYNPIEYIFSLLIKKLLDEEIENEKDIIKIIVKFKNEINKIMLKTY